jgi:hypothetical protein
MLCSVIIRKANMPPKGPGSPFLLFFVRHMKANPVTSREAATDLSKQAAGLWHNMSDAEKEVKSHASRCPTRSTDVQMPQSLL